MAVGFLAFVCFSRAAAQQVPTTISLADSSHVRIGSVDGPPETVFGGIVGAVRLASGQIVIADRTSHVVRFFDSSGRHLRSFGRQGRGPEEFQELFWIGSCGEGELLAVDPPLTRGTLLSSVDGRLLRTVRLPPQILFNPYVSCDAAGHVIVLLNPGRAGPRGQVSRFPIAVVRFSLESGAADTLARLPGTEYYFAVKTTGFSPLPLGAQAMAASSGRWLYAAQNDEEHVRVIDLKTGLQTTFRHGLSPPRMTSARWDAARSEFIERQPRLDSRRLLTEVLAEAPAPKRHPRFLDMKADRAGRVWLRLPSSTSTVRWRVYTPNGRHAATVQLPSHVQPLDIDQSHLVAVERDSLGVQRIGVYSFPSGTGPSMQLQSFVTDRL